MIFKSYLNLSILCLVLGAVFCTQTSQAKIEHQRLSRIVVFPIHGNNTNAADEAWWQMRESLTQNERFAVATKRLMINRGVFQARSELKPADAIILGKILDAQALMTTWVIDKSLFQKVYDGENGMLLFESRYELHPAIPLTEQIIKASTRLVQDFMNAIPYQTYQVTDPVIGKSVYSLDGKNVAEIKLVPGLEVGDQVQWVQVASSGAGAFFGVNAEITVIAEGEVLSLKDKTAIVEVIKVRDLKDLKEESLVRLPKEVQKLRDLFNSTDKAADLGSEYLSADIKDAQQLSENHHSTSSALSWIAGLALFVLLAF